VKSTTAAERDEPERGVTKVVSVAETVTQLHRTVRPAQPTALSLARLARHLEPCSVTEGSGRRSGCAPEVVLVCDSRPYDHRVQIRSNDLGERELPLEPAGEAQEQNARTAGAHDEASAVES